MNNTDIINLNVGGTKFTTTKQTLTKYKSKFSELIKDNSEIFIDRDGKYFNYILEFFRNGDNVILSDDIIINKILFLECQYYDLVELQNLLKLKYPKVEIKTLKGKHKIILEQITEHVYNRWVSNDKTSEQLLSEHELFKKTNKYEALMKQNNEYLSSMYEYYGDINIIKEGWVLNDKNEYTYCFKINNLEIIINAQIVENMYIHKKCITYYVNLKRGVF
jgi:hypothetical protein